MICKIANRHIVKIKCCFKKPIMLNVITNNISGKMMKLLFVHLNDGFLETASSLVYGLGVD